MFQSEQTTSSLYADRMQVRNYELSMNNCIRAQALCNYMEEVANEHAGMLGVGIEDLAKEGLAWALIRRRTLFYYYPKAGELVTVETWPCEVDAYYQRRDFSLRIAETGKPVAAASSHWVLFDLNTRKAVPIPPSIDARIPREHPPVFDDGGMRIGPVRDGVPGPLFPTRFADIDMNNHVNNIKYMDFIIESALPYTGKGKELAQLDIMYRAEAVFGDVIETSSLVSHTEDGIEIIHGLRVGPKEITRAKTLWK